MTTLHPESKRLQKHEVEAVAIECMDHRFVTGDADRKAIRAALGTDDVEFIQIAGGAGCFASIDGTVKAAAHAKVSLDVAIGKHHAKKILLTNHTECGAYGLAGFASDTALEEEKFHETELAKAAEAVRGMYPGVEVLAGFVTVDERDEPVVRLFA